MEEEKLSFNLPNWDTNPPLPEWNLPPHLGKAQLSIVKKKTKQKETLLIRLRTKKNGKKKNLFVSASLEKQ